LSQTRPVGRVGVFPQVQFCGDSFRRPSRRSWHGGRAGRLLRVSWPDRERPGSALSARIRAFSSSVQFRRWPPTGDHLDPTILSLMPGFIHDFKHGISAISNHSIPVLSMKKLISRPQSQKKRWGVRRAHIRPVFSLSTSEARGWSASFPTRRFRSLTSEAAVLGMVPFAGPYGTPRVVPRQQSTSTSLSFLISHQRFTSRRSRVRGTKRTGQEVKRIYHWLFKVAAEKEGVFRSSSLTTQGSKTTRNSCGTRHRAQCSRLCGGKALCGYAEAGTSSLRSILRQKSRLRWKFGSHSGSFAEHVLPYLVRDQ
jgi:hypothetical protein